MATLIAVGDTSPYIEPAESIFDNVTDFLASADWYDLDGSLMTSEKWENPQTAGFEVHIPMTGAEVVSIRIDRDARQCVVRRENR